MFSTTTPSAPRTLIPLCRLKSPSRMQRVGRPPSANEDGSGHSAPASESVRYAEVSDDARVREGPTVLRTRDDVAGIPGAVVGGHRVGVAPGVAPDDGGAGRDAHDRRGEVVVAHLDDDGRVAGLRGRLVCRRAGACGGSKRGE